MRETHLKRIFDQLKVRGNVTKYMCKNDVGGACYAYGCKDQAVIGRCLRLEGPKPRSNPLTRVTHYSGTVSLEKRTSANAFEWQDADSVLAKCEIDIAR